MQQLGDGQSLPNKLVHTGREGKQYRSLSETQAVQSLDSSFSRASRMGSGSL